MNRTWIGGAAILTLMCDATFAVDGPSSSQPAPSEWRYFGGSKNFDRYSPLALINAPNVAKLHTAWVRPGLDPSLTAKFPDLEPSNYLRGTPIVVDGMMYAPDAVGLVEAFDVEHKPARSLYRRILSTMPLGNPGTLSETEAVGIVLYCLSVNGVSVPVDATFNGAALNELPMEFPQS